MLSTETAALIALLRQPKIGSQTALRLCLPRDKRGALSPQLTAHLASRLIRPLNSRERLTLKTLSSGVSSLQADRDKAEALLSECLANGVDVISFFDQRYPPLLRLSPRPPLILYSLGDLTPLLTPSLAVVGTRQASVRGLKRAAGSIAMLSRSRSDSSICIISGLAFGIDEAAHRAALDNGLFTVAVVGSGLDRCTPKQQKPLWNQILASGGAIISEQPLSIDSSPASLVNRDRIQAGLAAATYVVESRPLGGALHTARASINLGRALWLPSSDRQMLSEFTANPFTTWLNCEERLSDAIKEFYIDHQRLHLNAEELYHNLANALSTHTDTPSLLTSY